MKIPIFESISSMEHLTFSESSKGNIDAVSNMKNDKIYVFAGSADTQINPQNGHNIASYYNNFVSSFNIKSVFNMDAQHCMPTDNYGGPCNKLSSNFINNCGYNAAYDLLNWIYGNLTKPTVNTIVSGQLLTFDQSEFTENSTSAYSMDNTGYVYIPSGCSQNTSKCKLHIALHGCKMGRHYIDDVYVKHTGYNEVGELNNIIILYPQAVPNSKNADGCWDMYGFTGQNYATNKGLQVMAMDKMRKRVIGH
ncbi:poly(3-hydroxybutyrate) depolymerase-like [Mytilus trossulus]|uniref:poly(3-hydroxybutyrate) depolymerase-like n=1 Tax=Mytilus trossulus TaxID=6551 RepID=UPI0030079281